MIDEYTKQLFIGICEALALEFKRKSDAAYDSDSPIYGEELDHNRDGVLECIERLKGKGCGYCKNRDKPIEESPCSDCEYGTGDADRFTRS